MEQEDDEEEKGVSFADYVSSLDRTMSIQQGSEKDLTRRTVVTRQEERRTKGGRALTAVT